MLVQSLVSVLNRFGASCAPGDSNFFGFPYWYKYLEGETDALGKCIPTIDIKNNPDALWGVALVLVEIIVRISAIVAVGFIIYAGFQYMTSVGSPEKTASAKTTIINALTGLVISIIAIAAVSFLGNSIK